MNQKSTKLKSIQLFLKLFGVFIIFQLFSCESLKKEELVVYNSESWIVTNIIDGQNFRATSTNGSGEEINVRLCGISLPKKEKYLLVESKKLLKQLIDEVDGEVKLTIVDTDSDGYRIAEVFTVLENDIEKSLQAEMLMKGLATQNLDNSGKCPNKNAFILAEEIGRQNHVGIWKTKVPIKDF